ncbi:PP2C family serine/threonine-protein phosphatase [Jiella mangrovi]|uniref:Protein phosphatase 2C domain-containing protein n=1 Tax=Jiella mangrovi TaxID=2821407 RepID=A0ABS4BG69_9HYPH|nr:PP2C family serine/threonine-protein phosphatase [Jiella mangrovi]MBP0615749.1 protein phosphatase 2C domain-containing protein [Jiella mangrovi]
MNRTWGWARARSVGTSHLKTGLPCQDFALCMEMETISGSVLAAVVSDGAGTASHAEAGSRMVCTGFLRAVSNHFKSRKGIDEIREEDIFDWLDDIRERVNVFARRARIRPRDCASTLIGLLAGPESALVVHIGDGAAVVREQGTSEWVVPSWPFQGEYASTTVFITDDPMSTPSIVMLPVRLDRVAIFSDGIERLVLDHAKRTAHGPFFDRVTAPVAASEIFGHNVALSKPLREYLDSKAICDRTDDDKSLILGARR